MEERIETTPDGVYNAIAEGLQWKGNIARVFLRNSPPIPLSLAIYWRLHE